jgi:hypothetical protein
MAQIVDGVVSTLVSGRAEEVLRPLLSWMVAILAGWLAGKAIDWLLVRSISRHPKTGPLVGAVALALSAGAVLTYWFAVRTWEVGYFRTNVSFHIDLVIVLPVAGVVATASLLYLFNYLFERLVYREDRLVLTAAFIAAVLILASISSTVVLSSWMLSDAWGWHSGWAAFASRKGLGEGLAATLAALSLCLSWPMHKRLRNAFLGKSLMGDATVRIACGATAGILIVLLGAGGVSYLVAMSGWWMALGLAAFVGTEMLAWYLVRVIVAIPALRQSGSGSE